MFSAVRFLIVMARYIYSCMSYEISNQVPMLLESTEATYLKLIFPDGDSEFIRNWECPEGVWTEDMPYTRPPSCVCVKGVFAIGTSLCDKGFRILTGNNHCFNIGGQKIRKYIPLTGKRGFAGKANTVFRADAPYFARLNSPTPVPTVPEVVDYIFRLNDETSLAVYSHLGPGVSARLKCLPGLNLTANPTEEPSMSIAWLPDCANEFRRNESWCSGQTIDYQWTLNVGESWNSSTRAIELGSLSGSGSCRDRAMPAVVMFKSMKSGKKRGGAKGNRKNHPAPTTRTHNCSYFPESVLDYVEFPSADHFLDEISKKESHPKFIPSSFFQDEVNKQNRRTATFLKLFYTGGDSRLSQIPRFEGFREFHLVRLGKELLKTICPEDYVPGYVVDFLIRAFRILYIDSSVGFAFPIRTNENQHKRIIGVLDKCQKNTRPIQFITNSLICSGLEIHGTNQSVNDTTWVVNDLKKNASIPIGQFFNESSLDMAVEIVWKIALLTHYYCSTHFHENVLDLSWYFVKVEAMLKNPKILYRWNHPGSFNRILQFFLMSYDLNKFARGVDLCVETVFEKSQYKKWMRRPISVASLNSQAKPLHHDVERSQTMLNFVKPRRRKRFYFQDDIWNNQGYCMRTTSAGYTEVQTSTFISCKKKPIWFENTD